MFNRKDYLEKRCTHDEYYSQFVTRRLIYYVKKYIGDDRIKKSTDPYFNDIPLSIWDAMSSVASLINTKLWKQCENVTYGEEYKNNFLWSKASQVCIAKQAARIIKEN